MKFKRTDLIERVKADIARIKKENEEEYEEAVHRFEALTLDYVEKMNPFWKLFASRIQSSIRKGVPITRDIVPNELNPYRGYAPEFFEAKKPAPRTGQTKYHEDLLALLEAIADEYVTTSAIEAAGFRVANIFSSRR